MRGKIVTAPDGGRWRVRRQWLNRPVPKPWARWRRRRTLQDDGKVVGRWSFEALANGLDSLLGVVLAVVVAVVMALVVFVLLPVIGIALELALLVLLVSSGLFGRVVLRRPWTIEAVGVEDATRRVAFAVTGWRRSRRSLAALAAAIETAGPPSALPEAEPLAAERPAPVGG